MSDVSTVDQFAEALSGFIDQWRGSGLTVAEAIGALECEKLSIWKLSMDAEDELGIPEDLV